MLRSLKNTFKIISVLSFILLGTVFITPNVALAGGFVDTCWDRRIEQPGRVYLTATCENRNGDRVSARLDLSERIANYNGNLSWANPQGNFQDSCRSIEVWNQPLATFEMLQADCADGNGGFNDSRLNLNERISNQNGVLAYD